MIKLNGNLYDIQLLSEKESLQEEFKMDKHFSKTEVMEQLKDTLQNGFTEYYADLHDAAFNQDYYIVGTYLAEQALTHTQIGVFGVLNIIREYEMDNLGEIITDISNPEDVANMYWYIQGEKYMYETERISDWLNEHCDDVATEELNNELIQLLV